MSPTAAPMRASAMARFTATVVLPTPPLPLATAISVFTPVMGILSCGPVGFPCGGGIEIHNRLRLIPEQARRSASKAASRTHMRVIRLFTAGKSGGYNQFFTVTARIKTAPAEAPLPIGASNQDQHANRRHGRPGRFPVYWHQT